MQTPIGIYQITIAFSIYLFIYGGGSNGVLHILTEFYTWSEISIVSIFLFTYDGGTHGVYVYLDPNFKHGLQNSLEHERRTYATKPFKYTKQKCDFLI